MTRLITIGKASRNAACGVAQSAQRLGPRGRWLAAPVAIPLIFTFTAVEVAAFELDLFLAHRRMRSER